MLVVVQFISLKTKMKESSFAITASKFNTKMLGRVKDSSLLRQSSDFRAKKFYEICGSGSNVSVSGAGNGSGRGTQQLTWEKLSPEEFQQLQDFAACKSIFHINSVSLIGSCR
jgi:hypothetical protein